MEILLIKEVATLGRRGAVVKVSDGYARNFLFPRGLAVPATAKNRAGYATEFAQAEKRDDKKRTEAAAVASRLVNVALTFEKLSNENGELYGSLSPAEVAESLAAQGFGIDKKQVSFDEPANRLGLYAARVKLFEGVEVAVPVTVTKPQE